MNDNSKKEEEPKKKTLGLKGGTLSLKAVSYTHLTLPTTVSV